MVTGHLGLLFVADEGAIALQDEVARPPCFNVFTCKTDLTFVFDASHRYDSGNLREVTEVT